MRDLIRKDKSQNEKLIRLQAAIQKGIDSGVIDDTIEDIMESVEDRLRKNRQL